MASVKKLNSNTVKILNFVLLGKTSMETFDLMKKVVTIVYIHYKQDDEHPSSLKQC